MKLINFQRLAIIIACCSCIFSAKAFTIDNIEYSISSDSTVCFVIEHYESLKGDIVIPNTVVHDGVVYEVTSVDSYGIGYQPELTSFFLPDGIELDSNPFYHGDEGASCSNPKLTKILVSPNNKRYVSENGVLYTKDKSKIVAVPDIFESFEIPSTVTTIGKGAFKGNRKLISITIPNSTETIETSAFSDTRNLREIKLPSTLTNLGKEAFCQSGIESLTIPDNIIEIPRYLCYRCGNLKRINFGTNVRIINESAFEDCKSLMSVEIPNSVEEIGKQAFANCDGLKSVIIGDGVKVIGEEAFVDCVNLNTVSFGRSLEIIGDDSFNSNRSLIEIKLPNSLRSIGYRAFCGCNKCEIITLGTDVKEISSMAFANCPNITTITIPKSVKGLGKGVFERCSALKTVRVPTNLPIPQDTFRNSENVHIIRY